MNIASVFRLMTLTSLIALTGCGSKKQEKPSRLSTPTIDLHKSFTTSSNQVTVIANAYDSQQCKDYFGVDLISYNIQPVVFEVLNDTPEEIEFRGSYIDLDLLSTKEVAQALHYSSLLWGGSLLGFGWYLFAPLMWAAPFMAYSLNQTNNEITQSVAQVAYDNAQPVLVFEPYTRNHFMICAAHDTFKNFFGLRFFVPDQKKLITMMINLKARS